MAMGVAARDAYEVPSSDDSINAAIVKFHSLRENIVVGGAGSKSQNLFLQD